jgi:acetyl esterase/lipase
VRLSSTFTGGGYARGSARSGLSLVCGLARRAGARAVSVGYRLAPEHPYPAALDDAMTVYWALLDDRIAAGSLVLAGDSAGGGLAVATAVAAREAGLPMPAAILAFSPWTDLSLSGDSIADRAAVDAVLTPPGLGRRAADYLGGADPQSPLASRLSLTSQGCRRCSCRSGRTKSFSMTRYAWPAGRQLATYMSSCRYGRT